MNIKNRLSLLELLSFLDLQGPAAEIGVNNGDFSKAMLEMVNFSTVYSIDIWDNERSYQTAKETLSCFGSRSVMIKSPSNTACQLFEDHCLDFIFVDCGIEHVVDWTSKLKINGFAMGRGYFVEQYTNNKVFRTKEDESIWFYINRIP